MTNNFLLLNSEKTEVLIIGPKKNRGRGRGGAGAGQGQGQGRGRAGHKA